MINSLHENNPTSFHTLTANALTKKNIGIETYIFVEILQKDVFQQFEIYISRYVF
jgi:hypothetical protein